MKSSLEDLCLQATAVESIVWLMVARWQWAVHVARRRAVLRGFSAIDELRGQA